jgi:hypothetical protein
MLEEEARTEAAQDWAECQIVIFAGLMLASLAIYFLLSKIVGLQELISIGIVVTFSLFVLFVAAPAIYWRAISKRMNEENSDPGYETHFTSP